MAEGRRAKRRAPRGAASPDAVFAALAHASRRHILHVLHLRGGAMSAGDIAERFSCSWPTTSRHLRVLEDAGLVSVVPRGRERTYHLERDRLLEVASGWLRWFDGPPRSGEHPRKRASRAAPAR